MTTLRNIIFWGAFPFVLPQALWVRKTAPRFARAAGPRTGTVGCGQPYHLLAVGDSIIAGVGASQLTNALVGRTATSLADELGCKIDWTARGTVGATSQSILERIVPRLPKEKADCILLSVGVNDVTALTTTDAWQRNLDALLSALHRHSPDAIIAVVGLPPLGGFPLLPQPMRALLGMRGERLDTTARVVVAIHPYALHVPVDFDPRPDRFADDGYHPSEIGYQEFGQITAKRIAERLDIQCPAQPLHQSTSAPTESSPDRPGPVGRANSPSEPRS